MTKFFLTTLAGFIILYVSAFALKSEVSAQACTGSHVYGIYSCKYDDINGGYKCNLDGTETKTCSGTAPCGITTGTAGCQDGYYSCLMTEGFNRCTEAPPSGGYGCVGTTCEWTSSGTSTDPTCGGSCTAATPPPPPPTCNGQVCAGDEKCCGDTYCAPVSQACTQPGACDPVSWQCASGGAKGYALVPGGGTSGCSEFMTVSATTGQVTISSVKTDGTPCSYDWSHEPGGGYPGLAVWEYTNDATKLTVGGQNWLNAIVQNYQSQVTFPIDTFTSHKFLITPACATSWNLIVDDQNRWDAIKNATCYRTVSYKAPKKTCTVSTTATNGTITEGSPLPITVTGNIDLGDISSVADNPTRLFAERTDFAQISPAPTGSSESLLSGKYYYEVPITCDITGGAGCSTTVDVNGLPAGSYNLHCDVPSVPTNPLKCSGNPDCSVNGGSTICSEPSCSVDDHLNVVVDPPLPAAPTGLVSACSTSDTMTLTWDPIPGVDTYLVRVDDGVSGVDNIDAVGYTGADTCAGYPNWDVCITVSAATTSVDVKALNPDTFTSATWRIYGVNSTGKGPYTEEVLNSCIPNCQSLSGPISIIKGQTANFAATFTSAYGFLGAEISAGQSVGGVGTFRNQAQEWNPISSVDCGDTTTSCYKIFTWDTANVPEGTYDVLCRAWNDGKAECRGNSDYVDGVPRYTCKGGSSGVITKSVTVLPPQLRITGTVYEGSGGMSGNFCASGSTPYSGGDTMQVTVSGLSPSPDPSGTTNVSGINGKYSSGVIQPTSGDATIILSKPAGYSFVCPANGRYDGVSTKDINADISGANFFISQIKSPWWQTRSGLVYGKSNIISYLPYDNSGVLNPDCVAAGSNCAPFLITLDLTALAKSAGLPLGPVTGTQGYESENPDFGVTNHSDSDLAPENYAVLSRRFDLSKAKAISPGTITDMPSGATGDALQGSDNTQVYYVDGDLTMAPSTNWQITGKVIVFVKDNVTIDGDGAGPFITVPAGNFFAVVAGGNITFTDRIGADPFADPYTLTPQIEGVYVADDTLTVSAYNTTDLYERKFVAAGSYVGLGGVSLDRDYAINITGGGVNSSGLLNNSIPTDTFIFRPDFILNTPELLKRSSFNWREINSVTQD